MSTVSNLTFSSAVSDWVRQTEQRMTAVFRESTQRIIEQMQMRVPVDTGFARASIRVSTSEMPSILPEFKGQEDRAYPYDGAAIALVIAGAEIGETIYVGYTAAYAVALEYGHSKQAPAGFVRLAAQNWPQIVAEVSSEAQARVQAN
jgi:hypothetical protein